MALSTTKKPKAVTVRNIDADVHRRLQQRAREHGISTEAEIRSILKNAVKPTEQASPLDLLVAFGKKWGQLPFEKNNEPAEPAEFE